MRIRFLGTRGSLPTPGGNTVIFGGNTTSIEFTSEDNTRLIIDAGTGITKLNNNLTTDSSGIIRIFITHSHWDHVQGLPFFTQMFVPNNKIEILLFEKYFDDIKDCIVKQMSGKSFPVAFEQLPSNITFIPVPKKYKITDNLKIEIFENIHPGNAAGLKIIDNNKVLSFITDNEIILLKEMGLYNKLLEFVKGSNIIIHDAQYVNEDLIIKKGWGHSTIEDVTQFFIDAHPEIGIFTHHDPEKSDNEIYTMEEYAKTEIAKANVPVQVKAAKENSIISL